MIIKDNDSSIEVLNIKEYASQTSSFWDVSFHRVTLPKSSNYFR
jgi:hypothetical protein